jgi:transcription initiation factor TFIIB
MYTKEKSKKKKDNNINKTKLWNIFDTNVENPDKLKEPLECVYRACGDREKCECCECILAFSEEGFLTCTNSKCGIIYKDILDQGAEWRYYGADDTHGSDPTRCGLPTNPLLEEASMGCKVLSNSSNYAMRKLIRQTEWQSMVYKELALYKNFELITTYARNSGIPKIIIDDALLYYKKISEQDVTFRGDNKDGILAASIYIACNINSFPRTAKEIAQIFHLDVTSATKGCKNAMTIINVLEKDMGNQEKTTFCITTPETFIERYCSKLNINNELTKLCQFIAIKIEKQNMMNENNPSSIAAGIVYYISQLCNLNITKKDVKNVSETSEVTINKCFKKLEDMTKDLIPQIMIKKYNILV